MRWIGDRHRLNNWGRISLIIILLGLSPLMVKADEPTVTARVDRQTISLDEMVNYTINIQGSQNAPRPALPPLQNLMVISQSQSTSISIINGQTTAAQAYTFTLRPQQTGTATIGRASLNLAGQLYETEPLTITVTPASNRPASTAPARRIRIPSTLSIWDDWEDFFTGPNYPRLVRESTSDPILINTTASRQTAYINQLIVLTFTFYRRVNLYRAPNYSPPETTGFWSVNLPTNKNLREVVIKGTRYAAQDFKTALFPTTTGQLKIGAATLTAQIDPFSDPLTIKTQPLTINVLPLPEAGKPADFSGAVGRYALTASFDRQVVERGKPLNLTLKVIGEGNLETIGEPSFEVGAAFRRLSLETKDNLNKGYNSVSGSKTFNYVLLPVQEGNLALGPFTLNYFDPNRGRYRPAQAPLAAVKVLPSNIPLPSELTTSLPASPGNTLRLSFNWRRVGKNIFRLISEPHLVTALGLLALFILTLWGWRRYRAWQAADPVKLRRLKALKIAKTKLKKAQQALKSERLKEFVAEIFSAVNHYLGDKYNFAAAGLTTDQLKEILAAKAVKTKAIEDFILECDLIRFTPATLDQQKARELLALAEKIIVTIESQ